MSSLWGSFIRKTKATYEVAQEKAAEIRETPTFKALEEKFDSAVDDVKQRANVTYEEIKVKTDSVVEEIKTKTDPIMEEVKRKTSVILENETVVAIKNKTCEAAAITLDFTEA